MRIFVFDCETTGLYSKAEKDISKQPYIIQFSWILVDINQQGEWEEIERIDKLIKPPILIPYVTSQIHWLYDVDVIWKSSFAEQYKEIMKYINDNTIVWHNVAFDVNMLQVEIERMKREWEPVDFCPKRIIDTMNSSINYCALPKKGTGKWFKRPKLQELTKKTLWHYFCWAHNAMVDVEYTLKAFAVLVREWVISLKGEEKLTLF